MKQNLRILIVDDHPMTVQGYEMALASGTVEYSFETSNAFNCDGVVSRVRNHKKNLFDVILLDINIPPAVDHSILSGEDLGIWMKSNSPQTKIIIHTGLNDQLRISSLFKTLNPNGFLIKPDITPEILIDAICSVVEGESYFSKNINRFVNSGNSNNIHIDSMDVKILYYLSIGEKMKNLPFNIPLSMATIERRKRNLKIVFDLVNDSDRKLIEIAKEKGFI